MTDLRGQQQNGFKVGARGQSAPFISGREWFLILVCLLAIVCAVAMYPDGSPKTVEPPLADQNEVPVMPALDLENLACALLQPDATEQTTLDWLIANPDKVPGNLSGPDPFTLAWWQGRQRLDRSERPLPRSFAADDLLRGTIPEGTPVLFSGDLVAIHEAHRLDWCSIALKPDRYVLLVVEQLPDEIAIGSPVRVNGRYLGHPTGEPGPATYGALSVVADDTSEDITSLLGIGVLPEIGQDGRLPPADQIFSEIDDIAPVLEKRPYYYMLGVVSRADRFHNHAYADARPALGEVADLHDEPNAYRGEPFVVRGYVLYSFEDHMVSEDHPFGIERVLRIVCWNTIWGPFRERDPYTGKDTVRNAWVRHTFEIAVIGDEPAPERGRFIESTGRFLKVHGVPANPDKALDDLRGVHRQSDNVYFKFFVADSYSDITVSPVDWRPLGHLFLIVVALTMIATLFLTRRDNRQAAKRPDKVRRLRRTRKKLGLDKAPDDSP